MTETFSKKSSASSAPTVAFDYIKGSCFRSIHVDGAVGSLTPNGHVHLVLYSERPAIPRRELYKINDDGSLGDVVETESRDSIVRELEADLFLTKETVASLQKMFADVLTDISESAEKT